MIIIIIVLVIVIVVISILLLIIIIITIIVIIVILRGHVRLQGGNVQHRHGEDDSNCQQERARGTVNFAVNFTMKIKKHKT